MKHDISSSDSIRTGLWVSLLAGLVAALIVYWALDDFGPYIAGAGACAALGMVAGTLNKSGYLGYTPPGEVGADTINGELTGRIRGPGYPWAIPGLGGQIPLNVQERKISPRIFTELVGKVPVEVELLSTGRIVDARKHFQAQQSEDILLPEFIETQARAFMGPWKDAGGVILQKDLVAEYLGLPAKADDRGEHSKLEAKLLECTVVTEEDDTPDLPKSAVRTLMANAGKVREQAAKWGLEIGVMQTRHFDLPQSLKDIGALALINIKRGEMIEELKKHKGIPEQDILNSVDMLMKLPITKSVSDIQIRDLDAVAAHFGKAIAELLFRYIKNTGGK
ncbi:MAG: hypothetical protein WDN10_01605 [bacterium]